MVPYNPMPGSATSTLHKASLSLTFIIYFLRYKVSPLFLTFGLSSSPLYSLVQSTLLSLTVTSVIFLHLLELYGDDIDMEAFLFRLRWVTTEIFVICYGLV